MGGKLTSDKGTSSTLFAPGQPKSSQSNDNPLSTSPQLVQPLRSHSSNGSSGSIPDSASPKVFMQSRHWRLLCWTNVKACSPKAFHIQINLCLTHFCPSSSSIHCCQCNQETQGRPSNTVTLSTRVEVQFSVSSITRLDKCTLYHLYRGHLTLSTRVEV